MGHLPNVIISVHVVEPGNITTLGFYYIGDIFRVSSRSHEKVSALEPEEKGYPQLKGLSAAQEPEYKL